MAYLTLGSLGSYPHAERKLAREGGRRDVLVHAVITVPIVIAAAVAGGGHK